MKRQTSVALWFLAVLLMALAGPVLTHAAPFAYITLKDGDGIQVIDASNNTLGALIPMAPGSGPIGIAVHSATNRAYVTNISNGTVSVIDTTTPTPIGTPIAVGSTPGGSYPYGIAVNPAGTKVYVGNSADANVSVIDATNLAATPTTITLPAGSIPYGIVVSPDGSKVYVADSGHDKVLVINTTTTPNVATVLTTLATGSAPFGIDINASGDQIYVANSGTNNVSVIDTATGNEEESSPIPVGTGPWCIAVSPDSASVYVTNYGSGTGTTISVINTATNLSGSPITVGTGPYGVQVNPAGTFAYVPNRGGSSVSVINTSTKNVTPITSVGSGPAGFGKFILSLLPTVTTAAVSGIGSTTATMGGNVNDDGGAPVTARGVCYGTTLNPALGGGSTCVANGSGLGAFSSPITGLTAGQPYHVRAYSTNSVGTSYGLDVPFTTLVVMPTVTTTAVTVFDSTTATMGGNVTDGGGATVTARGVCYGTVLNPALGGGSTCVANGSGLGVFSGPITGLTQGQLYHVRAYATNSQGTNYGGDVTFTTLTVPTVTTTAVTVFGSTTATMGGNVTADGGTAVTARGVCYGTVLNPALGGGSTCVANGSGLGVFSGPITGLTQGQLYHVRAYGTNSVGSSYGGDVTFTTLETPTVTTTAVSGIGSTTATLGGNVTDSGGTAVTDRGVCYGTASNPALGGGSTCVSSGGGTGVFSSPITGLTQGQLYHVRAYGTNSVGTSYGSDVPFTTLTLPTVTTTAVTVFGSTTATLGGNVTADGGTTVTDRGVCYGTALNPVIGGGNICVSMTSGLGVFSGPVTGLTAGQLYHVRAYGTNSVGTNYGSDVTFTTLTLPTVTTTAVTVFGSTTATMGGNVTADGGATVTDRGVCYGTVLNPALGGGSTCVSIGSGTGLFSGPITGLTAGQLYHVRAYGTNSVGSSYGGDVTFTTLTLPTVTTTAVTAFTSTTATMGGNVTADGGATVTARGVCYGTTLNPALGGGSTCVANGSGLGVFSGPITGLTPGQLYHVRAYGTNSVGSSYGGDVTFTTVSVAPTVTTTAVTVFTSSTATLGGNVTADGGATVTDRGVCYGTAINPALGGGSTCVSMTSGLGVFSGPITGLTPGQLYHVRAYGTNSVGTSYGGDVTFTTLTLPTVTTTAVTVFTSTTATLGGNVTADGGAAVTDRGVCYGVTPNPGLAGGSTCVSVGSGLGAFSSPITGLTPGQLYHVRAYGTNSVGVGYGGDVTFTTLAILPTVSTTAVTVFASTTATLGGNVTADGGATVTVRGVCYGTAINPALGGGSTCVSIGSGIGVFSSSIIGLTPKQLYHVRAYATNSVGTTYGSDVQFTSNDHDKIGVFRNGTWYLDYSGTYFATGTWPGCGAPADPTKEACISSFGVYGDIPVVGDWNGSVDGKSKIGVFRNGTWYLDYSGAFVTTGTWAGCGAPGSPTKEACIPYGTAGDISVVGDWNGDGKPKIGVFRNGTWYLDYSGSYLATGIWAGCGAPTDPTKQACIPFGTAGDIPVVGDWNGDGKPKIGVFRNGTWYLDYSGSYLATGIWAGCGAPTDPTKQACIPYGTAGDIPVIGNWNGSVDGKSKIGVFRNGTWYLDYSGSYVTTGIWAGCGAPTDPTKQACIPYGTAGDIPVVTK